MTDWSALQKEISACNRCQRLREHCLNTAQVKRRAYLEFDYWGKPVPDFGQATAELLIVGLAPAAHGANRTGRMFTGDRSGDFLFASLHRTGFANQAQSIQKGDGLLLLNAVITAAVHCAPPANKPTAQEQKNCWPFFKRTVESMPNLKAILVLGGIAHQTCLKLYREKGWPFDSNPKFGHGSHFVPETGPDLFCSYHPSQQNTFTKRLTPEMLDQVFNDIRCYLST